MPSHAEFYDAHALAKVRDFVMGNARVERAWHTIERWTPHDPRRVLELGCGVGAISWRIARRWPGCDVRGVDTSTVSVDIAKRLFPRENLTFAVQLEGSDVEARDLVVLMDMYEHVAREDRPAFHASLAKVVGPQTTVVLTFPTPRTQQWLRREMPDRLQPVDEDIDIPVVSALAADLKLTIVAYEEVDVWQRGDYAHAVLRGGHEGGAAIAATPTGRRARARTLLEEARYLAGTPNKAQRARMVHDKLGITLPVKAS